MAVPYQCLSATGQEGILCAARGSSIFTFAADGSLLSSWQHPKVRSHEASKNGTPGIAESDGTLPLLKRRKLETNATEGDEEQDVAMDNAESTSSSKGQKNKGKPNKRDHLPAQEHPFVNLVRPTPDGSYVVAVTSQDKNIWVFEHDGKGQLKELSQRVMPKRPSDLTITYDGRTILVADKFGDVYSLPLVPSGDAANSGKSTPKGNQRFVPKGANPLTVHSKRNLLALEDQRRQRETQGDVQRECGPTFEHELLLGHVSMLTSIILASWDDKSYILTADRDEHIRVSRRVPQAHIIENYCLGHTSFINGLCLLKPELLVSGGGDNELYLWDWRAGKLKEKVNLLNSVQQVVTDANKIAVSKLYSHDGLIIAICERVPAIFTVKLGSDDSHQVETLRLPGNPLDAAIMQTPDHSTRLIVSTDVENSSNLLVFTLNGEGWVPSSEHSFQETDVSGLEMPRAELDKILYTVENLRKTEFDEEGGDDEASVMDSEAGSLAAPES